MLERELTRLAGEHWQVRFYVYIYISRTTNWVSSVGKLGNFTAAPCNCQSSSQRCQYDASTLKHDFFIFPDDTFLFSSFLPKIDISKPTTSYIRTTHFTETLWSPRRERSRRTRERGETQPNASCTPRTIEDVGTRDGTEVGVERGKVAEDSRDRWERREELYCCCCCTCGRCDR